MNCRHFVDNLPGINERIVYCSSVSLIITFRVYFFSHIIIQKDSNIFIPTGIFIQLGKEIDTYGKNTHAYRTRKG